MKKILLTSFMAILCFASLSAADMVEGVWKSVDEEGKTTAVWKIYQKNNTLYGEIIVVPNQADSKTASACKSSYKDFPVSGDVSKMTVINTPFIYGLKMKSAGQWEGGNIIDPKDGKIYKCKITFRAQDGSKYKTDVLEMRGEIGLGIGRSQYWERSTEAAAESLRIK